MPPYCICANVDGNIFFFKQPNASFDSKEFLVNALMYMLY